MKLVAFMLILLYFSFYTGKILAYEDTDDDNGGHSSEFKPMSYEWKVNDFNPGQLQKIHALLYKRDPKLPPGNPAINSDAISFGVDFVKFLKALPGVLKELETDLDLVLKKNRINGIVTGRIKSLESLLTKMEKDGVTDFREITDIVGCRVTLQTIEDILKFKDAYIRAFNDSVREVRCYGVCGPSVGKNADSRVKSYWPWKSSGYRRLHFKVAVPELETAAEVQIGTPYMTLWADWEHDMVYKGPERLKQDEEVKEYAQRLAEYYTMLDNIRGEMIPKCPQVLRKANPKDILDEKDWKAFGSPLNACNFWNDLRTNMP